jgi:hypothetical protein
MSRLRRPFPDFSPFFRQTVKAEKSASGVRIPAKRGWGQGFVSTAIHNPGFIIHQFIIALALQPLFNDSMIQ